MTTDRKFPDEVIIDAEGIWQQFLREPNGRRPALFLDRDGVVVEETHYLHRPEDVRLIPGAAQVVALANRRGVPVVIVTNQGGIAYGYFGWDDFKAVQDRILKELAADGAFVDAVLACPYNPKGNPPYDHPNHPARKPNPGMLLCAAGALDLDLSGSWIVGDHATDIEAGRNAGLAGGVHVTTGHGTHAGQREAAMALARRGYSVVGATSITDTPQIVPMLRELPD